MPRLPFTGELTDPYGMRFHPITGERRMHWGVDGIGGPNLFPESGVLVSHQYTGGWGYMSTIRGDSGYRHRLAHSSSASPLVPVGSWQAEGTAVAPMGMTGTATGIHVHWEVLDGAGNQIDPMGWLTRTAENNSKPLIEEEDDDMAKTTGFIYKRGDGVTIAGLINAGSGFFTEWQDAGGAYNSAMAAGFDTGSFVAISESHRNNLAASAEQVRK
jgi:hypothetical protein